MRTHKQTDFQTPRTHKPDFMVDPLETLEQLRNKNPKCRKNVTKVDQSFDKFDLVLKEQERRVFSLKTHTSANCIQCLSYNGRSWPYIGTMQVIHVLGWFMNNIKCTLKLYKSYSNTPRRLKTELTL